MNPLFNGRRGVTGNMVGDVPYVLSLRVMLLLCLFWVQPVAAQQVPGGAQISYPLSGDVLGADDNTIYFTPNDERYIEWRITIGYSPQHTGLFDSGNVLFADESWELPIGTMPVDGRPVTLRFWQRTADSPWLYYDMQYTNASAAGQSGEMGCAGFEYVD